MSDQEQRAALLEAVAQLAPAIVDVVDEIERARQLPLPLVEALANAGLFRMMVPRAYGGLEADPLTVFEIVEAVARLDGSTGWIVMIGSGTPAFVAPYLSEAAAWEVFQREPNAVLGGTTASLGRGAGGRGRLPRQRALGVRQRQRALRLAG